MKPTALSFAPFFALATLAAAPALGAGERASFAGRFALAIDGVSIGDVHAATAAGPNDVKRIEIEATEVTPAVAGLVGAYLEGQVPARGLSLSSGAVVHKAQAARLVGVKLPSVGRGAPGAIAFTFDAAAITTSPLLRVARDTASPPTAKVSSFRLAFGELPARGASALDAVGLGTKDASDLVFDLPSAELAPFAAWKKGKPAPRDATVEYTSASGDVVLRVRFERCALTALSPDGPITHATARCARAQRG